MIIKNHTGTRKYLEKMNKLTIKESYGMKKYLESYYERTPSYSIKSILNDIQSVHWAGDTITHRIVWNNWIKSTIKF